MADFTQSELKSYLTHPGMCPRCKRSGLEGGSIEIDGGIAWQEINCLDCALKWNDIYQLTNAEVTHDPRD